MQVNAGAGKLVTLLLSVAVFAMPIFVATAQSLSPNVAQRQQGMKAMAEAAKGINAMFKDASHYDAKKFKRAAETIRSNAGSVLSSLFEAPVAAPGSKASGIIETQRPQFDKLAGDLAIYASALSLAADRSPKELGPEMRMRAGDSVGGGPLAKKADARDVALIPAEHVFHLMLQTCTSCHAKFRVETK